MGQLNDARPRRQAIVEMATRDRRALSHRTYAVTGTADNPMTSAEVQEKARDLLSPIVGMRGAQSVIDTV
jgi:hypothetical protein